MYKARSRANTGRTVTGCVLRESESRLAPLAEERGAETCWELLSLEQEYSDSLRGTEGVKDLHAIPNPAETDTGLANLLSH